MKFIKSLNLNMIKVATQKMVEDFHSPSEALSVTSTLKLRAFIMRYVNIIIFISYILLPL